MHVLLSEVREEANWNKAQNTYGDVQRAIVRGDQLELYGDVERLLPANTKPQCVERVMEIEPYIRLEGRKKSTDGDGDASPGKGKARPPKRKRDAEQNMPPGASSGFVSVKDLVVVGEAKKKKRKTIEPRAWDPSAVDDDDDDREIEAGPSVLFRRVKSMPETSEGVGKNGKKLRRTKTTDPDKAMKRKKSTAPTPEEVESEGPLASIPLYDSDIEMVRDPSTGDIHFLLSSSSREDRKSLRRSPEKDGLGTSRKPLSPVRQTTASSSYCSSSRDVGNDVIVLSSSPSLSPISHPNYATSAQVLPTEPTAEIGDQSMAWLIDDDEEPDMQIVDSSPILERSQHSSAPVAHTGDENEHSNFAPASRLPRNRSSPIASGSRLSPKLTNMDPPPLPSRLTAHEPSEASDVSLPARPRGRKTKSRRPVDIVSSSPILEMPPPSQRRLQRRQSSSPTPPSPIHPPHKKSKGKEKRVVGPRKYNPWIEAEAEHSGDEMSAGVSSHSEDDVESDSDRQFLTDHSQTTQASPSYNQTLAYRQSLLTQAPAEAPKFAGRKRLGLPKPRPVLSSSPTRGDNDVGEYSFGTFVVDDDAELEFDDD